MAKGLQYVVTAVGGLKIKALGTTWEPKQEKGKWVDMPTEDAFFHLGQMQVEEDKRQLSVIPDNFIQLEASREPLLTWAPKVPASHPVDYPVPSFGADPDIEASLKNSAALNLAPEEDKSAWE